MSGSSVLYNHDILIIHVDADVAGETYANGNIKDAPHEDLPCEEPCPPPDRTTNALRAVILNWLGKRMNVRHGLSCARLPRASKPGCLPRSGRTRT